MEVVSIFIEGKPMMQVADLGYDLHSRPYAHAPGCSRLDVVLRGQPTRLHFDPERIHLTVADLVAGTRSLTIAHASHHTPLTVRACAGRVIVEDRLGKHVEFLTLGGTFEVWPDPDQTLCSLRSPAPIIALRLTRCVAELLAEEIEEILAIRRAHWEEHRGEFDRRLAAARPEVLYRACLVALQDKFRRAPREAFDDLSVELVHFLREEIALLQADANLASAAPCLDDIL